MRVELTEVLWLEEHAVSLSELSELSGLSPEALDDLVGTGAIEPIATSGTEQRYGASAVIAARHARRLCDAFDLDRQALPLVLGLLERIDGLEQQLRALRAKMPGRLG
ncbi:MAG TPA: chaperone modulator CbpM [Steroidobacteraceae bacterium]|jgi:hypothetical protein